MEILYLLSEQGIQIFMASHSYKKAKREWLPPLRDSLRKACRPLEKLFSLEETQVYNPDLARQLGLKISEFDN